MDKLPTKSDEKNYDTGVELDLLLDTGETVKGWYDSKLKRFYQFGLSKNIHHRVVNWKYSS